MIYLIYDIQKLYQSHIFILLDSDINVLVASLKNNHKVFFIFFFLFRATPAAYGASRARGGIGAAAAGFRHSHSNARSELRLLPTVQLRATLDPLTQGVRPGIALTSSWILVGFFTH